MTSVADSPDWPGNAQLSLVDELDTNALDDIGYHLDALIREGMPFSAESIRERLSPYALAALAEHTGTLGSVIRHAHKAKRIERIGMMQSTHSGANGRILMIWKAVR